MLRPRAVDDAGFTVATDTDDDGRTRYRYAASGRCAGCARPTSATTRRSATSADRLARLGVEQALTAAGAVAGDDRR